MIDLALLVPFISSTILLSVTPGPDNIFVLMQSIQNGFKQALKVILGLCTGLACHTLAGAMGLTVVIQSSPKLYQGILYFGAGYLIYLAYLSWKHRHQELDLTQESKKEKGLFVRGIVMNLTNPKIAIFFLAYFPQFISVDSTQGQSVAFQFIFLGIVFALVCLFVFSLIALLAGKLRVWLAQKKSFFRYSSILAAIIYLGLAINIVFL